MGTTERIRSRAARSVAVTAMAAAGLGLVLAVAGGGDTLLRYAAPTVLVGVLAWAAFWRPYVEISDGGLRLANTLRTVEVPWPAVQEIDGRYGLRLVTAYGTLHAWGAAAPSGRRRARRQPSVAAQAATTRLEELRAAGHLDDPRLERARPVVTWDRPLLLGLGALVLASLVLPLLA